MNVKDSFESNEEIYDFFQKKGKAEGCVYIVTKGSNKRYYNMTCSRHGLKSEFYSKNEIKQHFRDPEETESENEEIQEENKQR